MGPSRTNSVLQKCLEFYHNESGQAVTEYIIILFAVLTGVMALARAIIASLDKAVLRIGGQLEKDLKTGRHGLGIWKN